MGRRGSPNINDTTYAYLVNLSTEGVKNPQNSVNVVHGCPLGVMTCLESQVILKVLDPIFYKMGFQNLTQKSTLYFY